jgi:hypothetical protein
MTRIVRNDAIRMSNDEGMIFASESPELMQKNFPRGKCPNLFASFVCFVGRLCSWCRSACWRDRATPAGRIRHEYQSIPRGNRFLQNALSRDNGCLHVPVSLQQVVVLRDKIPFLTCVILLVDTQGKPLQKVAKGTKVRVGFATPSLSSLPSVGFSAFARARFHYRQYLSLRAKSCGQCHSSESARESSSAVRSVCRATSCS